MESITINRFCILQLAIQVQKSGKGGHRSEPEPRSKPTNFLEIHAGNQPDKTAIIGLERSLTYGLLQQRARALSKSFYQLGIRPGEQIAIMSYNLPEYSEVANALTYLEVGLVKVGYRMQSPEIEYIVENSDSKLLIFWHEFAERIVPYKENYKKVLPEYKLKFMDRYGPCLHEYCGATETGVNTFITPEEMRERTVQCG